VVSQPLLGEQSLEAPLAAHDQIDPTHPPGGERAHDRVAPPRVPRLRHAATIREAAPIFR
jgi:hypothetical protein